MRNSKLGEFYQCCRMATESSDRVSIVKKFNQNNLQTISFRNKIPCRLIKLTGVFPKLYGSIMIQNDFRYREQFNRMYIRMQTAGIVKRSHKQNTETKS